MNKKLLIMLAIAIIVVVIATVLCFGLGVFNNRIASYPKCSEKTVLCLDGSTRSTYSLGDTCAIDPCPEDACVTSGGTIINGYCSPDSQVFPNTCLGVCDVSPQNIRQTKICACTEGKCFNGIGCVSTGNYPCSKTKMQCADGKTMVSQQGPNCEYAKCPEFDAESICIQTGGTVSTGSRCFSTGDFTGEAATFEDCPCYSCREAKYCSCSQGKWWRDGIGCSNPVVAN